VSGCRKAHMCQLVIDNGVIKVNEISLRFGPCICELGIMSYSKNKSCKHFATLSTEKTVDKFPKLRAWRIHELKKRVKIFFCLI
jgi:ribosomal protein L39E